MWIKLLDWTDIQVAVILRTPSHRKEPGPNITQRSIFLYIGDAHLLYYHHWNVYLHSFGKLMKRVLPFKYSSALQLQYMYS